MKEVKLHPYEDQTLIIPKVRDIDAYEIRSFNMNIRFDCIKCVRIKKNIIYLCKSREIKAYYEIGFIEDIKFIDMIDFKGHKVNTAVFFRTGTIDKSGEPYYVRLNCLEKCKIGWHYKKLWIQQSWFYTMAISFLTFALSIKLFNN